MIALMLGGMSPELWGGEKIRFSHQSEQLNLPQSRNKQDLLLGPSPNALSSGGGGSPFMVPPGLHRSTRDSSDRNSEKKSWIELSPEDLGSFLTPERAFDRWGGDKSLRQNWLQLDDSDRQDGDSNDSTQNQKPSFSLFGNDKEDRIGDPSSSSSMLQTGKWQEPFRRGQTNETASPQAGPSSRDWGRAGLLESGSTEPVFQSSHLLSDFSSISRRGRSISDLLNSVSKPALGRQPTYAEEQQLMREEDFERLLRPSAFSSPTSGVGDLINRGEDTTQRVGNPFEPERGLADGESSQRPGFMDRLGQFDGNANGLRAGPGSLDAILGNAGTSRSPSTTPSSSFTTRPSSGAGIEVQPPILKIPGRKF